VINLTFCLNKNFSILKSKEDIEFYLQCAYLPVKIGKKIALNQFVDLSRSIFSRFGGHDPGTGSLHIAVRRAVPVGLGNDFPSDHPTVRLLESDGTHREEDHGDEEHVPNADRGLRSDRWHLHEPSRHHREILLRSSARRIGAMK